MTYAIHSMFYTLQGEGARSGRAAVFIRFAGCNLWSGRERDRATAICRFCDTEFVGTGGPGGGRFDDADAIAAAAAALWPGGGAPYIVCTGGEPALQLDHRLVTALHHKGFEVAVESNGTLELPFNLDWICVSPKADTTLVVERGDELKLIYPQRGAEPERYAHLGFRYFFVQPMDGPQVGRYTRDAVAYCRAHPQWRLSLQTHKILDIP